MTGDKYYSRVIGTDSDPDCQRFPTVYSNDSLGESAHGEAATEYGGVVSDPDRHL